MTPQNADRIFLASPFPTDPLPAADEGEPPELELAYTARTDVCVLISGRAVGARSLARRIHGMSGWRNGPFIVIDCGWPEALLEMRLFGALQHESGFRRGGPQPRLAQAGTLFLQEVGRLELAVQTRLSERLARVRGDWRPGRSRWRLMASTSEPLFDRVQEGAFLDGLFYRLNVIHLTVPDPAGTHPGTMFQPSDGPGRL